MMNRAQNILTLFEAETVRPATEKDHHWIERADLKTYGKDDHWKYTPEQWKEQVSSPKHNLHVYGKAYMQTTHFPERGHYLTSLAGNQHDASHLLRHWINNSPGRKYTHADPKWMGGKIVPFLQKHGFKHVGMGDPKKETGKWAMDISKLHELEHSHEK